MRSLSIVVCTERSAVKAGHVHELEGADILSPGPSVLLGLRRIHDVVQRFLEA